MLNKIYNKIKVFSNLHEWSIEETNNSAIQVKIQI